MQDAYLASYSQFMETLKGDAQMLLALCDTWLDPLGLLLNDEEFYEPEFEEDTGFWMALTVARKQWPVFYADMCWMDWEGHSDSTIEHFGTHWLNNHIPSAIMSFEELQWGVPIQYMGRDEDHNDELPSGVEFIDSLLDGLSITALDVFTTGYINTCPEISALIEWLFSRSGNTTFDYTADDAAEMVSEYPDWEELEFVWAVHLEAWEFDGQKDAGLNLIEDETVLIDLVDSAMIALARSMQREFYEHSAGNDIEYPRPGRTDTEGRGQPIDDDSLLSLRDCAAA